MRIEHNPPGTDALYLDALNRCFPGWGDTRTYDWVFRRAVGGPQPDRMLVYDDGTLIAGSAVSYRHLRTADGTRALVGIMTGSWTLPAARGRGAFSRIIEASRALTAGHGGALLLAFVTETNASFRRLQAAGSALFPTRYVSSGAPAARAIAPEGLVEHPPGTARLPAWFERFEKARPPGTRFAYDSPEAWLGQHVERPARPSLVELPGVGAALVEVHGDFERVQALAPTDDDRREALLAALLARATSAGRRLFLFESSPERATRWVERLGLQAAPGALTALPAAPEAAAGLLRGASLEARLGHWSLDSGDRM